jgi:hypothetical protein
LAKYISARRENAFNVFSIGLGFGFMEAVFFSVYTYRAIAFHCLDIPALKKP